MVHPSPVPPGPAAGRRHASSRRPGRRRTFAALAASLTGLALSAALGATPVQAAGNAPATAPVVRIHEGLIRGVSGENGTSYLGIPYAKPPVGPLRWKPPAPPEGWRGVRDATKPGNPCMQSKVQTPWGDLAGPGTPSEDCLYLNVHVPAKRSLRPRPVMVWIHGGGFTIGSGAFYDGGVLAQRGDVIVVTLNYRLGAFGFLAHAGLSAESPTGSSGNYGLLDQQAALRWVQRNIAAFGGNPRNVTIFGESAGGGSVCQNLISPLAKGLFHRAIAQSGCAFPAAPKQTAEAAGENFAAAVGCFDVACLRAKPAEQLLAAAGTPAFDRITWGPSVDGHVVREQVMEAFRAGRLPRVPVIQGTTRDEARLNVATAYDLAGRVLTAEEYPQAVRRAFPSTADQILARYRLSDYGTPAEALAAIYTDAQFACPSYASTALLARHTRAYAYEFSDPHAMDYLNLPVSFPLGAPHGSEIRYIFGGVTGTPAQQALADRMLTYWTRFAHTGVPNGKGSPVWKKFPLVQDLAPGAIKPTLTFAKDHKCDLWAQITG
ncbi:Carboxylesterase [Thermomonospora curvata DSM 43183]|uniref:Carboxylic ester hydrolase n=1 Tax=Thermomonospora curvata (strain ATCC 19995 / DSM 43183 / JCM 3096 / KCTC 9072 / NBRC 15933 / NCIMB 10081 / Henssen B9) TaxID=471852 RepID=D1A1D8_THECD|nr:Carboxylesterase [Thermomonospora curvata DSM 43183]PKK16107.1 MAG: carboxylesterase family protein [Thermomonospora sp. CIF 1]